MAQMTDIIMDPEFTERWEAQRKAQEQKEKAEKEKQKTEKSKSKAEKKAEKTKKKAKKTVKKTKKAKAKAGVTATITNVASKTDAQLTSNNFIEIPASPVSTSSVASQSMSVLPIIAILGVCLFFVLKQRKTNRV